MQSSETCQSKKDSSRWRTLLSSYVVLGFVVLVVADLGLRIAERVGRWPITPYHAAYRSWVWWNADDFRKLEKAPDIVLLGSSLMMAALHGGDAVHLNSDQNAAYHHRSHLLESQLKSKLNSDVTTFAFALGGEMASDAYVMSRTLLFEGKKPKTIIYGVAPRDFMDKALGSPASTEPYKLMERLGGLNDLSMTARTSFWEQVEYVCTRVSALYDHRPDFVYLQHRYTKQLLTKLCGMKDLELVHTPFEVRKQAFQELPGDSGPNEVLIGPPPPNSLKYQDNLDEYRYRYAKFDKKQFDSQVGYLDKLMSGCEAEGINVILVNMPLTRDNIALMPPGLYDNYMSTMKAVAQKYKGQFLDLSDESLFPKSLFHDSVHLNAYGGKQFFEVLAAKIADSRVASAMVQGGVR